MFGTGLAVVVFSPNAKPIPRPLLLFIFVTLVAAEWFLWRAVTPPSLKADATQVSSVAPLDSQRMLRSDLGLIFRGQVLGQGRYANVWVKMYLFAGSDGKIGLRCGATGFADEGVVQFAQHLQVPIRGDFSAQVKDRVDPTST